MASERQPFVFERVVQHTEVVTVLASSLDEARQLAEDEDGERNHDDIVIEMRLRQ